MTEARTFYLAMIDYGPKLGRSYQETDEHKATEAETVRQIADGYFGDSCRVVKVLAINESEGTVKNVTKTIAEKVKTHIFAEQAKWGREPIDRPILDFICAHTNLMAAVPTPAADRVLESAE